jgi:hypothetical protein
LCCFAWKKSLVNITCLDKIRSVLRWLISYLHLQRKKESNVSFTILQTLHSIKDNTFIFPCTSSNILQSVKSIFQTKFILSVWYIFPHNLPTKRDIFIKLSMAIMFTFMTFNSPPTDDINMTTVWISELGPTICLSA